MLAPWLVCIGDSEEVIINLGLKAFGQVPVANSLAYIR